MTPQPDTLLAEENEGIYSIKLIKIAALTEGSTAMHKNRFALQAVNFRPNNRFGVEPGCSGAKASRLPACTRAVNWNRPYPA